MHSCDVQDYILANEKYMEMAIGNAPWPIGVTNAGIHARWDQARLPVLTPGQAGEGEDLRQARGARP